MSVTNVQKYVLYFWLQKRFVGVVLCCCGCERVYLFMFCMCVCSVCEGMYVGFVCMCMCLCLLYVFVNVCVYVCLYILVDGVRLLPFSLFFSTTIYDLKMQRKETMPYLK